MNDVSGGEWEGWRSRRQKCAYCREVVDGDDGRAVHLPGRGSSGWFCSRECLRNFLQHAAGIEVAPCYGELLDLGTSMIHACEDW